MRLYDIIYDKDAYIEGILVNEKDGVFNVLWRNDVIGIVTENDDSLDVVSHLDMQSFYIEDILHTGNSGVEYTSKIGQKYDERCNKVLLLDRNSLQYGNELKFYLFSPTFFNKIQETGSVYKLLYTTAFENIYEEDGYIMLRTFNSIYKLTTFECKRT